MQFLEVLVEVRIFEVILVDLNLNFSCGNFSEFRILDPPEVNMRNRLLALNISPNTNFTDMLNKNLNFLIPITFRQYVNQYPAIFEFVCTYCTGTLYNNIFRRKCIFKFPAKTSFVLYSKKSVLPVRFLVVLRFWSLLA